MTLIILHKLMHNLISKPVFEHIIIRYMETSIKPKSKSNESSIMVDANMDNENAGNDIPKPLVNEPLSGDSRITNTLRSSSEYDNQSTTIAYDSNNNIFELRIPNDEVEKPLSDQSSGFNNPYLQSERVQSSLTRGQISAQDKEALENMRKRKLEYSDSDSGTNSDPETTPNTNITVNKNMAKEITESPETPKPNLINQDVPLGTDISVNENNNPFTNMWNNANTYWTDTKEYLKRKSKSNRTNSLIIEDNTSDNNNNTSTSTEVLNNVTHQSNEYLGQEKTKEILNTYSEQGNSFTIPENRPDTPIIVPHVTISPTILVIDQGIKATVSQLDDLSNRFGIQVEKSVELASKWDDIKVKLDTYIKSLEDVNYKKVFTYAGCTMAILYLVYQIGIYRKLPDFLISIASHIPLPNFKGNDVPIPKPSMETTFNKVMDMPLTPLTIVTSVGSIVTVLGLLKASLWIIRKLRK